LAALRHQTRRVDWLSLRPTILCVVSPGVQINLVMLAPVRHFWPRCLTGMPPCVKGGYWLTSTQRLNPSALGNRGLSYFSSSFGHCLSTFCIESEYMRCNGSRLELAFSICSACFRGIDALRIDSGRSILRPSSGDTWHLTYKLRVTISENELHSCLSTLILLPWV